MTNRAQDRPAIFAVPQMTPSCSRQENRVVASFFW